MLMVTLDRTREANTVRGLRDRRRLAVAIVSVTVVATLGVTGCAANLDSQLIGTWETQLVGYNSTAQSVTNYKQTVSFAEDGSLAFDTTLPGAVNHATGVYEISDREKTATLSIKWDMPVDQPTTLYFAIEDGKLITSPSPGGLSKPQNLNVTNADPVVYTRGTAP